MLRHEPEKLTTNLFQTILHISSSLELFFWIKPGSFSEEKNANIQCFWLSKHWSTTGASFPYQLASAPPQIFHQNKLGIHKNCTLKWEWLSLIFNALIETRQLNYRALFWRLHGFSKRGFLNDILRNTRFPFRGKPNRVTRHCFALAPWSTGIIVFLNL